MQARRRRVREREPCLAGSVCDLRENLDGQGGAGGEAVVVGQKGVAARLDRRRQVDRVAEFDPIVSAKQRGPLEHGRGNGRPENIETPFVSVAPIRALCKEQGQWSPQESQGLTLDHGKLQKQSCSRHRTNEYSEIKQTSLPIQKPGDTYIIY